MKHEEILGSASESEVGVDIELAIWKEIASGAMSVSHDRWHIERVLQFAKQLQELYGGDIEIITAAVLLHDLGRADVERAHGEDSIRASVEKATEILQAANFAPNKRKAVLTAIEEHDKPGVVPSTIEGKILKDADFLAGFGAWGVLRIAMWSGESQRRVNAVFDRLTTQMIERYESLIFPESKEYAWREILFARLFYFELQERNPKLRPRHGGAYVILEGISGSGKDTQSTLLADYFGSRGYRVKVVSQPGDIYRLFRDAWQNEFEERLTDTSLMKYLFMADREWLMKRKIIPYVETADLVIGIRSFVSTLVYECKTPLELAATAYQHNFVLLPDRVFLLDIDARKAFDRIQHREKSKGLFESVGDLERARKKYIDVCEMLFRDRLHIIDASQSQEEVFRNILNDLFTLLEKEEGTIYE